ncbi:MAG TPA: tetratricopeptide repeat protein [Rhodanobacteraceae bacterium]|jgi:adenylate cyclase|nr:tetratricopeptide repeat protein [Rhodanobacteraceae bacterium]
MSDWVGSLKQSFAEFRRRRVFRVVAVYAVTGWVLIQLGSAVFEPLGLPSWSMRLLLVLLALGFVLACVLAWVYDIGAHGIERTAPLPQASPAAKAAAPGASVAILPFADLSEAHDQAYFCDGLAEEILNALASIRGLRVASRTSSFRFRESTADVREIGRVLNVAAIMEGSVRKSGQRVRVTAQLIDAGNGYHLWSESFDRGLADVFAIQEEIARSVARALRVSLKTDAALDIGRNAPRDMRAYEFYLRGRQIQSLKSSDNWPKAPQMFRRAIELDPDYAQAHAGLADSLAQLLIWRIIKPEDALHEALAAAKRALELAPELAEAHVAHANTLSLSGDNAGAVAEFERAIELNPELYEAHYYFGRHCYGSGDHARAIEEFEAAHRVRPDEFQALSLAANAADSLHDPARGDALTRLALPSALAEIAADPENGRALYLAAGMQVRLGDAEGARRNIEAALRLQPDDFGTLYNAACTYTYLGDTERALDLLERAISTGHGFREWIEHDPDLDRLRGLPRYREIMRRLENS